jgi:hypothetical protein
LAVSRNLTPRRVSLAALAASLLFATLACQIDVGGPEPPGDPIPVSTQAAEEMAQTWQSALATAAGTGTLTILLNESQVTSYLALRLAAQENPVLQDPQVFLRDGVIQVYGVTEQGALKANVLITVTPRLDPDGSVSFEIAAADVGPLPVPETLRQSVSALLTETLTSPLGSLATGIRVTVFVIADGQVAITGELR